MNQLRKRQLRKQLLRTTRPEESPTWTGLVGDGAGNVKVAGREDLRYVRPDGSNLPVIVRRGAAPDVEGVRVWVGKWVKGDRIRILGVAGGSDNIASVHAHAGSHYLTGTDPVFIDTVQVLNGLAYASGDGMNIAINAGWAVIEGQPVYWEGTVVDATGSIPVSGACYGLLRVDASGVIDIQVGDPVDSFLDLTWSDVPALDAEYAPNAIVRLYAGQTDLSRSYDSPDVIDIRFAPHSLSALATHTHVEADITDLLHNAVQIQGIDVSEDSPNDEQVLAYDSGLDEIRWVDQSGGGESRGVSPYWWIEGAIGVQISVGMDWVAERDCTISQIILYCREPGSAGSTIVDVNIDGESIFPGSPKPTLAYDDADKIAVATPDTVDVYEGNLVSVDVDSAATAAEDMLVVIVIEATGTLPETPTGWFQETLAWTYGSSDAPSYVFTISGDLTGKYFPGMRIKLTQPTDGVKYFIITKVDFTDPDTEVTVYGGTDYDLDDESITDRYYSTNKVPFGFPLDRTKWTVVVTDTTTRQQASPAQNTWYNTGSIQISVPIGAWHLSTKHELLIKDASNAYWAGESALSTSASAMSDNALHARIYNGNTYQLEQTIFLQKDIVCAAKTSYYLIHRTTSSGLDEVTFNNNLCACYIWAVCTYL